jgi:phosphotransferase system  glucose/maltose/N-acetylglucosamine-specific IIC component
MDTKIPREAVIDARPRRAVTIILIVMGVFIIVPFVLYVLAGKSALSRP